MPPYPSAATSPYSGFVQDVLSQPQAWHHTGERVRAFFETTPALCNAGVQTVVHFVGEGSSFHVAQWLAQYGHTLASQKPMACCHFKGHRPQALLHGGAFREACYPHSQAGVPVQHLWVFISQSGQTGVLKRVMASLQAFCSDVTEASHHVLVLTNQSEARLTQDARIHQGSLTHVWEWAYQAGAEQAIAATKSVTCSLLSGLALIHHLVADVSVSLLSSALFPSLEESQVLHSALQRLYAPFKSPLALVKPSIPSEVILLGHTRDEGLLHEVGLKWIEMAGLHPIVLNTETFQHGYKALCTARPQLHDHRGYPAVYLWLPEEATARNQVLQDIEHLQVQGVLPALPASSPDDIAFTRRTEHTHTALPAPSDTKQLHHYHGIDATHWCACFPSTYFAEASFPRFARESLSLLLWGQWMAEYFRLQVQAPPDALPGLEKVVQ